ncbi:DUF2911 domain-containing protein [Fulvivirga sp. RKSG066]|uniref:DUF2911 domain-containing protein n=1 Tax=Fulvivirga aurantia TaxID=2529383 RepID=UPI0012BC7A45|nr:DUF2911 domain-containing protein [Fulvivirga aurantia]MTI22642.1 DUF2911 domain-containing protein [Fulvivirga aurantia]
MKKFIVIVGIIIALLAGAFVALRIYTKQFSPQEEASFKNEDVDIEVNYSRPYKKDRKIFGELVPYGEVWRTGANEATSFTTNVPLNIKGEVLPAGSYSIFTIPGEDVWQIIFNSQTGQWGIALSGEANYNEEENVLTAEVASVDSPDTFEQFTISFEQMGEEIEMILMWDQTLVVVPMTVEQG